MPNSSFIFQKYQPLMKEISGGCQWFNPLAVQQGLSRYLETGCPNRGFIDFWVSQVWYKKHTTNKIDPIPLQILLF